MLMRPQDPSLAASITHAFAIAWGVATIFYFLEYAVRSSPAVMIPELSRAFGVSAIGVSSILGTYYYTYSTTSLVAGVLLDRWGARYVVPTGIGILGLGCVVFAIRSPLAGDVGRLMQGAGSAFAFTGAVYLASRGFAAKRLATAIGATQCLGMLGGTAGQILVGPIVHGGLAIASFWIAVGGLVLMVGIALLLLAPKENIVPDPKQKSGPLSTYRVVFTNPQSYLCGMVAGLLFVPTTIGDMVWGVRFFQEDKLFSYSGAVLAVSMVPLGWVFGCPLLGFLADHWGKRKPPLVLGASIMLASTAFLVYVPQAVPAWLMLLILGVASGAAMIPYTIIKEANPDCVKGSATGAINYLTFGVTAIIGPVFAGHFGRTLGMPGVDPGAHFRAAGSFWIGIIAVALIVSLILRETGKGRTH